MQRARGPIKMGSSPSPRSRYQTRPINHGRALVRMRVCLSSTQANCGVLGTRQQLPCIAVEPGSPPPISRERALSTGHFASLSLLVVVPNPTWQPLSVCVWRLAHVRFDHRCSHATVAQCPVPSRQRRVWCFIVSGARRANAKFSSTQEHPLRGPRAAFLGSLMVSALCTVSQCTPARRGD